jgi:S-DNA-T family DNA segregation ATPase FtsK/SpoIIIE
LLHVLISTLTLKYSPEEVQLYLIDFKKGVEFKTYATHQLPHARVIAIESEREFGLSVLEGLDAELKLRGDLFRNAGVDSVKDFRQKTNQTMPRILLLVDEFQEFFTEDDAIASKCSQILDRLVRQGRAFGIHVLLGSQTLAGAYTLARSTIDQMAIRIALQCSEADSRLILSDDNPAARLLSRPGEAIYNSANGLVEGNNLFQVAWLPDEKQDLYLDKVKALAEAKGFFPPKQQIVFEGNAPANPEKNLALNELLLRYEIASQSLAMTISPALAMTISPALAMTAGQRVAAWLGEPIAIKAETKAHFRRQSGSNLLIVGQNEEAAMGTMMTSLLSLSAQYPPEAAAFYLLDFGNVDAPYAHLLNDAAEMLLRVKYGKRRQLPDFMDAIAQEVNRRLEQEPLTPALSPKGRGSDATLTLQLGSESRVSGVDPALYRNNG